MEHTQHPMERLINFQSVIFLSKSCNNAQVAALNRVVDTFMMHIAIFSNSFLFFKKFTLIFIPDANYNMKDHSLTLISKIYFMTN